MVAKFKAPVNILFANTKNIGGKAFGQMLIQLPEDELLTMQMLHYLEERSVKYEEVTQDV
jgi:NIL domain.